MEAIYLFNIGDKIVYPSQGVGIIDSVEEKEIRGKVQNYYKINLLNNNLEIMIPISRLESSNIRLISDGTILDNFLNSINDFSSRLEDLNNSNCKERMHANNLKLKSGSLTDYVEVICNLTEVNSRKPLNSNEKQMLNNTKKFLIDEISLIKNISTIEATNLLNDSISSMSSI